MSSVSRREFLGGASVAAVVPVAGLSALPRTVPPERRKFNVAVKRVKKLKVDGVGDIGPNQNKDTQVECEQDGDRVKFKPPFGKPDPTHRPTISFRGALASLKEVRVEVDYAEVRAVGRDVWFLKAEFTPVTGVVGGGEVALPAQFGCCLFCDDIVYCGGPDLCIECEGVTICCP